MTTPTEPPQEVIVSHSHVVDDPTPWRWANKKVAAGDIRLSGRGQFPDCESAVGDAERRGHTVVGIRE